MRVQYEERREFNASSGYMFTNESVELSAKLARDAGAKSYAGICSGGDLLFGAFAPNADKCVMIDHSLSSLKHAMTKAILIENMTGTELKRLLEDARGCYGRTWASKHYGYHDPCPLQDAVNEALKDLPEQLARQGSYHGEPNVLYAAKWGDVWRTVTGSMIDAVKERLDTIKLIHGDLRDLEGEFDLLYLSNALEHTGFDGKAPDLMDIMGRCIPKHVLYTGGANSRNFEGWEKLHDAQNGDVAMKHAEEMTTWRYNLMRKKAPQAEAVKLTT